MITYKTVWTFASTYGSNAYDTDVYNGSNSSSTVNAGGPTSGTSSANGSALTNTGIAVAAIVTLAAVILLVAIIVRIWKRPGKRR